MEEDGSSPEPLPRIVKGSRGRGLKWTYGRRCVNGHGCEVEYTSRTGERGEGSNDGGMCHCFPSTMIDAASGEFKRLAYVGSVMVTNSLNGQENCGSLTRDEW